MKLALPIIATILTASITTGCATELPNSARYDRPVTGYYETYNMGPSPANYYYDTYRDDVAFRGGGGRR